MNTKRVHQNERMVQQISMHNDRVLIPN